MRTISLRSAQVLLKKKYDVVIDKYLVKKLQERAAFEEKVVKIKDPKKRAAMTKRIPAVKPQMSSEYIDIAIGNWVISNRQRHVTRLMNYENYELWPVMTALVREKAIFGSQIDARKFCLKMKKGGKMYQWIVDNGGMVGDGDDIGVNPVYTRIPTQEQLEVEIYEAGLVE